MCRAFDHDLAPALDSPAVAALTLGGVWPTEPRRCYLRVFINHEQPSVEVDVEHVCHVPCLAFVCCHVMTQPATVSLDITDTVRGMKRARRLDVGDFYVQLLPVGGGGDGGGAPQSSIGIYLTAAFDYGSYLCHFETGIDRIPRFDAHLEVYGHDKVVRIQCDTPYVRNLPVRLLVTEANGRGGVMRKNSHPACGDPFVAEWKAFYDNAMERKMPKTSAADFVQDLELLTALPFGRYMLNSFFVSGTITVVALLLHSMAAFAFARLRFPGRDTTDPDEPDPQTMKSYCGFMAELRRV